MDYVDLRPGTHVSVIPAVGDAGAAYEATVRSVSERDIHISTPHRDAEQLTIEAGAPITLFTSVEGQIYRFPTRVRHVEESPAEGLIIEPPVEAEKNERRSYYRLLTRIVPRYAAIVANNGTETPLDSCVILDISGGGLQMQSLTRPDVGARLHLLFALEGDPLEVDIYTDVLTVQPPSRAGRYHRIHGRFFSAPRGEVERLVRYVTRQQVERRRKGLL